MKTEVGKFYNTSIHAIMRDGMLHDFAEYVTGNEFYTYATLKPSTPFSTTYDVVLVEKETKKEIIFTATDKQDDIGNYTEIKLKGA